MNDRFDDFSSTSDIAVKNAATTTFVAPWARSGPLRTTIGALFLAMMMTIVIAVAIWPGEMKLLAPLFCTDAQPDAFVVTDSYQVRPGETSYNFSMYCMGPRGDVTSIGVWKPYGTLFLIHLVIAFGLIALLGRSSTAGPSTGAASRRPRSRRPSGSTAGPFVD